MRFTAMHCHWQWNEAPRIDAPARHHDMPDETWSAGCERKFKSMAAQAALSKRDRFNRTRVIQRTPMHCSFPCARQHRSAAAAYKESSAALKGDAAA